MLKPGDRVTIRLSKKLRQSGNDFLANRDGIVTRVAKSGGRVTGAYVKVQTARGLKNYYVPIQSIEGEGYVDRLRTLWILKKTIL